MLLGKACYRYKRQQSFRAPYAQYPGAPKLMACEIIALMLHMYVYVSDVARDIKTIQQQHKHR